MKKRKNGNKTQHRQTMILRFLKEHGKAQVDDLADLLKTTQQTIRKDLSVLESEGQITRFHGGALLLAGTEYASFTVRNEIAREEKQSIGRAAAKELPNNCSIMLNAGTTTTAVARRLRHHAGLKVVADSVYLANLVREFPGVEVMVPAGIVRTADGAILGETAVDFIKQIRADFAVIGAVAIAPDGALLDYDLREIAVTKAIIANARKVILTADSSKFGSFAPMCFGQLDSVDTLVTDKNCPQALEKLCAECDVELVKAD